MVSFEFINIVLLLQRNTMYPTVDVIWCLRNICCICPPPNTCVLDATKWAMKIICDFLDYNYRVGYCMLPSYVGIIKNHYKLYEFLLNNQYNGNWDVFFFMFFSWFKWDREQCMLRTKILRQKPRSHDGSMGRDNIINRDVAWGCWRWQESQHFMISWRCTNYSLGVFQRKGHVGTWGGKKLPLRCPRKLVNV